MYSEVNMYKCTGGECALNRKYGGIRLEIDKNQK
jgi:hypothetical protein